MHPLLEKIKTVIANTKFENKSYVAGGFVRDLIMNRPSKDIDIVVELPNGGIELAEFLTKELHGTNVVIFERFGTAQIVVDGLELEFVMTRKETYNENDRKCEVEFGTIYDDVLRRDFTINSLLLNISTGEILDLCNGIDDIKKRIIKTTGDPNVIFTQDPLRIMRAIRLSTILDFRIELSTLFRIKEFASKLNNISRERIQDEFVKILASDGFDEGIKLCVFLDIFKNIGLPQMHDAVGMTQNAYHYADVFQHTMDVMSNAKPTALHRLSAMLHDIGKVLTRTVDEDGVVHFYGHEHFSKEVTDKFMKELKFSNEEIDLVSTSVLNHMRVSSSITDKKIRQIRSELGDLHFSFLLDLCEADRLSCVDKNTDYILNARTLKDKEPIISTSNLPINGIDMMTLFNLKPGIAVGKLLKLEADMVCENPNITKNEIIVNLKKVNIE